MSQSVIQVDIGDVLAKVRQMRQVVVIAAEALGQFHPASTSKVKCVVAHAQHLNLLHQVVAQGVIQMGPFRRNLVRQCQTVGLHLVIDSHDCRGCRIHIQRVAGSQRIRHCRHGHLIGHCLSPINGDHRLDDGLYPVNVLKTGVPTDFHRHQTIGIGGVSQAFKITSC